MLEHLAYGNDSDIIALLLSDGKQGNIADVDMTRVSGVSRAKDGSLTLSLVDRFDALSQLAADEVSNRDPSAIYDILGRIGEPE